MIVLELIEQRFPWRGFWLEWLVAAALIVGYLIAGADLRQCGRRACRAAVHRCRSWSLSILLYPLAGRLVAVLDRLRLIRVMDRSTDEDGRAHVSSARCSNSFDRRSAGGRRDAGRRRRAAGRAAGLARGRRRTRSTQLEAESNRVNLTLIPPRRGWMLDRNGAPLASNRADFRVDMIPDRLVDAAETVDDAGPAARADARCRSSDLKDKIEKSHGFQPVEVASGLDWERFAAVSVRLPELPGVVAAARLFALLSDRAFGRPPGRLCRPSLGRGI